jgi:hypothetical protein
MKSEAHARDGGKGDLIGQRGGGREEPSDLLHTEDGGETVGSLSTNEHEGVPVAREDVLQEAAEATGADAHGRWGEAVDVFAVQEVRRKFLCRDAIGGFVGDLSQQAYFPDIGVLGTLSLATELKRGDHVLTQWGHEISPFVH